MRSVEIAVICNAYIVPIVTLEIKTLPNSFSHILAGHRCPPTSAKSVSNHMTIASEIVWSIHFDCLLICGSIPCVYAQECMGSHTHNGDGSLSIFTQCKGARNVEYALMYGFKSTFVLNKCVNSQLQCKQRPEN